MFQSLVIILIIHNNSPEMKPKITSQILDTEVG